MAFRWGKAGASVGTFASSPLRRRGLALDGFALRFGAAFAAPRDPCLIRGWHRSYGDAVEFVLFIVNAHRYRCPPPQAGCGVARD